MVRTMDEEDLEEYLSIQWGCVDAWVESTGFGDVLGCFICTWQYSRQLVLMI
jgi:hypothetical protein